nr:immunoglobulin heavy chain junction region [Macaca mulatta]MOV49494.1 immunoglobulin heavy chain junction region [Macaca mulatta]MOV49762.1 immunoglobulin heavy chain junction region [Macaca mulatta]MOV49830.1 immunoglobulin heavy chain junction region [Macaca mulatta]MOV50554.1 immunoglobulin heavy chain junction region [Macaca mulatta]
CARWATANFDSW